MSLRSALRLFILAACTPLSSWSQPIPENAQHHHKSASESSKRSAVDILKNRDDLGETQSVQLVFVIPYSEHYASLDEFTLRQYGCKYATNDPVRVREVLDVLESAEIELELFHEGSWEARNGLFLISKAGIETKLLFDQHYEKPVKWTIEGELNGTPIRASKFVLDGVYRWAAKLEPNPKCDFFLSKYRN